MSTLKQFVYQPGVLRVLRALKLTESLRIHYAVSIISWRQNPGDSTSPSSTAYGPLFMLRRVTMTIFGWKSYSVARWARTPLQNWNACE